jgi:hypothetical protein
MRQPFRKLRLLILPFLLMTLSNVPVFASEQHPSTIHPFQLWYVHAGDKHQVSVKSGLRVEVEQVLNTIDHLSGLSSFQLPVKYVLIQFDHPIVLSEFSPIHHPFQSMIVTFPKNKGEPNRLLIKNSQGSWVEYHTTRSLSIFIRKINPSSIKDEGLFVTLDKHLPSSINMASASVM